MGRLYCNGKKGFCERVQGTAEECENVSCTACGYADGTGAEFIDQITNYDNIRNMSVDEMAEFLKSLRNCNEDVGLDLVEWLKKEAENVIKKPQ